MRYLLPLLAFACCNSACGPDPAKEAADTPWVPPGCGDGELAADEECDEGDANSDETADACRSACLLPACGDGVADSGEECDDGGPLGGDGCTPSCLVEAGSPEIEPNDAWDQAQPDAGGLVHGSLAAGDVDCFAVDLAACDALSARLVGSCPDAATLRLHDPTGAAVAVGSAGADGCASLDPAEAEGARFVAGGAWAICVEGLLGGEVPAYTLEISPAASEPGQYPVDERDDPDADGLPDRCDDDQDGDGVADLADNCIDAPNGPAAAPLAPDESGFLRAWLAAGPFTGTTSSDTCRASDDQLVAPEGGEDADAQPALGEQAGSAVWRALWSGEERIELLTDFGYVEAPREAYLAVYVYSAAERTVVLALGPDDGARAWLRGEQVLDITGCQGTVIDQFQAEVTLLAGWQPLLLKIRDQGGGWGVYARFLQGGAPVTDLELSLDPSGSWADDQGDADEDGVGDACDPTPAGG